ncbi:uncharacterized protein PG986_009329 [Apiospora aurea]|uniref:DUF7726 domain-containing protein n=1 Tax=Apiospora aurea TaxID=335848 RepID=A0ABR1Q7H1_9PEZI
MAPAKSKDVAKPKAAGGQNTTGGKKRKSAAAEPELTLEEEIAAYKQDLDDFINPAYLADLPLPSAVTMRNRLNKLFDRGIMTKAEFCRTVGTNSNTLNRFLAQTGPVGSLSGSSVYGKACIWFQQRDEAGLMMPDVRKRQKREADAAAAAAASTSASSSVEDSLPPSPSSLSRSPSSGAVTATTKDASARSSNRSCSHSSSGSIPDITEIHLDGEDDDAVPIYDTCDEVRRKISAHLRKTPGLTEAAFRRTLFAQLRKSKGKGIQSKQLSDFRSARGSRAGIQSCVYYAAYVYFEKLRLARGQPESEHREIMEDLYVDGIDRNVNSRTSRGICFDEFGQARTVW